MPRRSSPFVVAAVLGGSLLMASLARAENAPPISLGDVPAYAPNAQAVVAAGQSPQALADLGAQAHLSGDYSLAETYLRSALAALDSGKAKGNAAARSRIYSRLGIALKKQGRLAEAADAYEQSDKFAEAAGETGGEALALRLMNTAELKAASGRLDSVGPLYERAIAALEKAGKTEGRVYAAALNNYASLHMDQGRPHQADPLYRKALELRKALQGPQSAEVAETLINIAELERSQNRLQEAATAAEEAVRIYRDGLKEPEHPNVAAAINVLGHLRMAAGEPRKAEAMFKRALEISEKKLGDKNPRVALAKQNLGAVYESMGRVTQARPLYDSAVEILRASLGDSHPDTRVAAAGYGRFLEANARALPGAEDKARALAAVFGEAPTILPASKREIVGPVEAPVERRMKPIE